ncbi:MAG: transporter [Gemmatimonadaceae bacterium]
MPVRVHRLYFVLGTAVLLSLAARSVSAQTNPDSASASISDNSFLIEEAYNQESGVVQHIFNYRRARDGEWLATFTQEWPIGGQRDQFSYTLPLQSSLGSGASIGDAAINYRRQLLGHDDDPVWFAPRLSLVLPSGSARKGTGAGGPGVQLNLPLSVRVNRALVTHWNAGASITRARSALGPRGTVRSMSAGASAIWLAAPTFNLMLETVWDRTEALDDAGVRAAEDHFVILPGVRGAINLPHDFQIVPGIGVPVGIGPSHGERDLFLYLSFEHPFR